MSIGYFTTIWVIFKNVVFTTIFIGVLSITSTSVETIVVSALMIIYQSINLRMRNLIHIQIDSRISMIHHCIFLAKHHNNIDLERERFKRYKKGFMGDTPNYSDVEEDIKEHLNLNVEEITMMEEDIKELRDGYYSTEHLVSINLFFIFIIVLIAYIAIIMELDKHFHYSDILTNISF